MQWAVDLRNSLPDSASPVSVGRSSIRERTSRPGTFSPAGVPGRKRHPILTSEKPVWRPFQRVTQSWPQWILFGQAVDLSILTGIDAAGSRRQTLAVVP